MGRTSNFTDRQRADLFVRDRAACAYSGRNLWLLDYGADPYYQVDWADHRVPVASGGQSTLANGVCASWAANFDKRDRVGGYVCLFIEGRPTTTYLNTHTTLPRSLERRFRRFSRLHYSDWYLNRALFRLWLGVAYLSDENCERTRDDAYYARAAYRILIRWRTISKRERVPTLEERAFMPRLGVAS